MEITKDGGPPLEKSRTKLSSVSSTDATEAGLLLRPGTSGMTVITYKCVILLSQCVKVPFFVQKVQNLEKL